VKIDKAVVASNYNPLYLNFWPIVRNAWLRLQITPILILIGQRNEITEDSGGIIHEIQQIPNVDSGFQAQISRLYITKLYEHDVCITSDIDMLPINYEYYHSYEKYSDDQMLVLSSDAHKVPRYPMCYNIAKGAVYKEILDLNCHFAEFTHRLLALNHGWDTDEIYFTKRVDDFCSKNPNRIIKLNREWINGIAKHRIDRAMWKYDQDEIHTYIDSHMLRPLEKYKEYLDYLLNLIDMSLISKE